MTFEYYVVNGYMHNLDLLIFNVLQDVGAKGIKFE
jgi:hypothetical protein